MSERRVDERLIEFRERVVRRLYSVVIPSIDTVRRPWNAAVVFPGSFVRLTAHLRLALSSRGFSRNFTNMKGYSI